MSHEPEGLKTHETDYKPSAWKQYTILELGAWVHLLVKRAGHRSDPEKKAKDLYDARNYLSMIEAKIKEVEDA